MHVRILVLLLAIAERSLQDYLCPGFNFAFWSFPGGGDWRWMISDDNCNVQSICGNVNPCDCLSQACSPSPAHVKYVIVDTLWQVSYSLYSPDSVDCRNDGKRNFEEGLINKREYEAIEETNALLDIQRREFDEVVESGKSESDIKAMREVHKRDLEESEAKQHEAHRA
ncbi:uncharacterized protein PAC_17175 [Phialocephala subalpina]|uniref:Extracellular membrane protein CFEM domain-containing protein n=1 Tax=Phialocephala subalpina TaxID=576137 RepID=A0A1L7XQF9_9HELO|nr:uncharacterized protein PAC_17175 [Phialocephala subalpina]